MRLDKKITLICAMRYALGRKTYVVSAVVSEILNEWNYLNYYDKVDIRTEIEKAINDGEAGDYIDVLQWRKILNAPIDKKEFDLNKNLKGGTK